MSPLSKAINFGDPSISASDGELDYDGLTRIVGERIDCGAYEAWEGIITPIPTSTPKQTATPTPHCCTDAFMQALKT
ncbi:MAG: hypothetical protein N2645_05965 [Clostridia bacterium]|nr:hypothetical protein [Clostridia bacterium]